MQRLWGRSRPVTVEAWGESNGVAPHVVAELKARGYKTAEDVCNIEADEVDHLHLERKDKDELRHLLQNQNVSKSEAAWNYTKNVWQRAGGSIRDWNKAANDLITHGKTRVKELPEQSAVKWIEQEVEEVDDHEGAPSTRKITRQASLPPDIGSNRRDVRYVGGDTLQYESQSARSIDDLPQFSTMFRDGVVSHYRLHMNTKETHNPAVRWHTFGPPTPGDRGRCCLLIGASSGGKSCLVDAIFNHLMRTRAVDGQLYHATTELNKRLTLSNTRHITAYTLYPLEGTTCSQPFTIIDTPGLGQTGSDKDSQQLKELGELIQSPTKAGLPQVDVLYLVVRGMTNRLTASENQFLTTMLPCLVTDPQQLQIVFTFSDGSTSNAFEALRQTEVKFSHNYHLDNCGMTDTGLSTVGRLFLEQNARSLDAMLHNFPNKS